MSGKDLSSILQVMTLQKCEYIKLQDILNKDKLVSQNFQKYAKKISLKGEVTLT